MKKKAIKTKKQQKGDCSFDLTDEQIRKLGYDFTDIITSYFTSLPTGPILPEKSFQQLKKLIEEPVPQKPMMPEKVLDECQKKIVSHAVRFGHPRFLGWTLSSGTIIGGYADGLASVLNQNVSFSGASVATVVELTVLEWIKKILGYEKQAAGILVSGGSLANLHALMIARNSKCSQNIRQQGLRNKNRLIVYTSSEAHVCIDKAVDVLGIGTDNIRRIPVDTYYRMDIHELIHTIQNDIKEGFHPFCIVGTAGTVNTGAIDPLNKLADIGKKYNIWFHVDAAYGGFVCLSSRHKSSMNGIHRADSIAIDPHKWLFISYEAGCILVKNPENMKKTFSYSADYLHLETTKKFSENELDFADYSLQLSRSFKALKIWMSLKQYGTQSYGKMIDQNIALARYLQTLIKKSIDFKLMALCDLSVVCFRYEPQKIFAKNKEQYLNLLNQGILRDLRKERNMLISHAVLHDRFVLRACIVNYRTSKQDIKEILSMIQVLGKNNDRALRSQKN